MLNLMIAIGAYAFATELLLASTEAGLIFAAIIYLAEHVLDLRNTLKELKREKLKG